MSPWGLRGTVAGAESVVAAWHFQKKQRQRDHWYRRWINDDDDGLDGQKDP